MAYREYVEWIAYFKLEGKPEEQKPRRGGMSWRALKHAMITHMNIVKGKSGK